MIDDTILQAVSTVGFPIVACVYMAYANKTQTESHRAEMDKVTEALNELKIVINSLKDKLN